ncbi:hypothetical protein C7378_2624 [Acidipila rosea]|uniref:Uncharacterized protein n=1 Tax=Acidipila rosea TaxID=768535 RepID=A0A4R1L201_9BACT|nr:hypothetical protein C7378_2624 [Acidipila rosea]
MYCRLMQSRKTAKIILKTLNQTTSDTVLISESRAGHCSAL